MSKMLISSWREKKKMNSNILLYITHLFKAFRRTNVQTLHKIIGPSVLRAPAEQTKVATILVRVSMIRRLAYQTMVPQ